MICGLRGLTDLSCFAMGNFSCNEKACTRLQRPTCCPPPTRAPRVLYSLSKNTDGCLGAFQRGEYSKFPSVVHTTFCTANSPLRRHLPTESGPTLNGQFLCFLYSKTRPLPCVNRTVESPLLFSSPLCSMPSCSEQPRSPRQHQRYFLHWFSHHHPHAH